VLSLNALPSTIIEWTVISSYFLAVLINILILSWFDLESDRNDGQQSFAIICGARTTRLMINVLFLVQSILLMGIAYILGNQVLLLLMMNGVLFYVSIKAEALKRNDNFRLLSDAIFLLPLLDLFLRRIF
jgi:4-hydroxybenzoate polyprenyltransferase